MALKHGGTRPSMMAWHMRVVRSCTGRNTRRIGAALPCAAIALVLALSTSAAEARDRFKFRDLLNPITDETDDWRQRTTFTGRSLTFYGQISMGALAYDDGVSTRGYAPVDNSNSGSRVGILWQLPSLWQHEFVLRFEAGITPSPTSRINQTTGNHWRLSKDDVSLRKMEVIIDDFLYDGGTLTLGQGSMATDGIAEIDLSRTAVSAYSDVGSSAGGQFLRFSNGVMSTTRIGDVFNNYDGDRLTGYNADGSRKLRVRYDTPKWKGFSLAVAFGTDVVDGGDRNADIALRYERTRGGYRISAGLGYAFKEDREVTSGSFSMVHLPSGLTFSTAAGHSSAGGSYGYLKLGRIQTIFDVGDTAFSVDFYNGRDVAGRDSRSRSVGLAVTQAIERHNIEVFALLRRYSYEIPAASYRDSTAFLTGLRWKF